MGNETIDVLCFVFPDGSTSFIPTDDIGNIDRARDVMDAWKARLPADVHQRYEESQVMGGFVWMHMLEEDYKRAMPIPQKFEDGPHVKDILPGANENTIVIRGGYQVVARPWADDGSGSIERHENSTDWGGEG